MAAGAPVRHATVLLLSALFALSSHAGEIPPRLIAHAGGGVRGLTYTNSLQALDCAADAGFAAIEVDLAFTRDGQLVLVHKWTDFRDLFAVESSTAGDDPLSLAEFRSAKSRAGLTQLTLADLGRWMRDHESVDVVTDFKHDLLRGLATIGRELPELRTRFVPQIYQISEGDAVRELGFDRIILTIYRIEVNDATLVGWLRNHEVWAVATPLARAGPRFLPRLSHGGRFIYAYTVNEVAKMRRLRDLGVDGFYTDWVRPSGKPGGCGGRPAAAH